MIANGSQHAIAPVAVLVEPKVPAWACDLAPRVAASRVVELAAGVSATLETSRGDGAAMVTAVMERATDLSAEELRASVSRVYASVLEDLRASGLAHPVRMWNFVPGIHDRMGVAGEGMDRYRVFNAGRYDALSRWFGGPEVFGASLPAASAVGHRGSRLVVCVLGSRTPGVPVENPRQVPAFGYSRAHGPRPPCFARATVARLPMGTRLLVSGTASIRGEDSVHAGSLAGQAAETFENIESLVRVVRGTERFAMGGIETARVYFASAADRAWLEREVRGRLPESAAVEFVPALICRAELMVEIEATFAPLRERVASRV